MSAPKQITVLPCPPLVLSPQEKAVVHALRAMSDHGQNILYLLSASYVDIFPRRAQAKALRLVDGSKS